MIAISAELATVWPNVGPISWMLDESASPNCAVQRLRDLRRSRPDFSAEIWMTLRPSSAFLTVWIFASPKPAGAIALRTCASVAGRFSAAVMRVPDSKSMPKLRPLAPMARPPTSRIRPEAEKNHFDAPMKSNVIGLPRLARSERRRPPQDARVAHREQDRLRGEDRGEQRHERADAEHEGEALDPGRGQDEEDEGDEERDDVRVDDRREALLVALRDARGDRATGSDLLFHAFEDDDVRVRRDADREDQAGDARAASA